MSKFNMKLSKMDEEKINFLKQRYGYTQTSELIRHLLTNTVEQVRRESPL